MRVKRIWMSLGRAWKTHGDRKGFYGLFCWLRLDLLFSIESSIILFRGISVLMKIGVIAMRKTFA